MTTELLGFNSLHYNVVYAQMSRGKTEKLVSFGMATIAATLSRLAMDACLYMNQNFGFISFPDELTTGSSIMPHKKNPDVFELIRARSNRIQSIPNELTLLMNNLPSGYHRDMQLTKEILFPAIEDLKACISMTVLMLSHIRVKKDILQDERYKYLFSVEAVNELANQGIPFRDAYKTVGDQISKGDFFFDQTRPLKHTHEGSLGNLNLAEISSEMDNVLKKF
jgi:argininosuccinate lyase